MRRPTPLPSDIRRLVHSQDGVVTRHQLLAAGLTRHEVLALLDRGWRCPVRGVCIDPAAPDPFRASVRAALLARPDAVAAGVTAARLRHLWGLPRWVPAELPQLLLPEGRSYHPRAGMVLRAGLREGEQTHSGGFPITTLDRTVRDVSRLLRPDDVVCLLDSALREGWRPEIGPELQRRLRRALRLADARSESPLETCLRLLLIRAGLAPEALQYEVRDGDGRVHARLDLAWPSAKLAIEADGRLYHDAPEALYRDRSRANRLELEGWTVLRFTWDDLRNRPGWVLAQVRTALDRLVPATQAV